MLAPIAFLTGFPRAIRAAHAVWRAGRAWKLHQDDPWPVETGAGEWKEALSPQGRTHSKTHLHSRAPHRPCWGSNYPWNEALIWLLPHPWPVATTLLHFSWDPSLISPAQNPHLGVWIWGTQTNTKGWCKGCSVARRKGSKRERKSVFIDPVLGALYALFHWILPKYDTWSVWTLKRKL